VSVTALCLVIILHRFRDTATYWPKIASVHLSVCPSVTRVDQSKTVEVRIMQLSPHDSSFLVVR